MSDSISEYEPAVETLGPLYDMHWPTRQFETARDLRLSPMCNRMLGLGAVMGGMRRADQNRKQAQQQQQWEQEQAAQYQQGRNNYNRAYAACMEGRGYTVR